MSQSSVFLAAFTIFCLRTQQRKDLGALLRDREKPIIIHFRSHKEYTQGYVHRYWYLCLRPANRKKEEAGFCQNSRTHIERASRPRRLVLIRLERLGRIDRVANIDDLGAITSPRLVRIFENRYVLNLKTERKRDGFVSCLMADPTSVCHHAL